MTRNSRQGAHLPCMRPPDLYALGDSSLQDMRLARLLSNATNNEHAFSRSSPRFRCFHTHHPSLRSPSRPLMTMFTTSNFRFLRINKTTAISLNLVLAKEDVEWFSDYSFQETLAILKPLLLARIDMYNQGHLTRLGDKAGTNDPDNLEDVGVVLGGDQDAGPASTSRNSKRQAMKRPRFSIWYGFRDSTMAERGSALLLSNKNLGFLSKVKEEVQEEGASKLVESNDDGLRSVVIREEEDDSLRVSDFPLVTENEQEGNSEDEYQDPAASSKRPRRSASDKGKGQATKKNKVVEGGSAEYKPALNVSYSPLKLLPHTLHISIRSLGASTTGERITGGDVPEDEQDLFPPNLDFFA